MYLDITLAKILACLVGLSVLCCMYEYPYWRRRRRQRNTNRVAESIRAGTPLHEIEDNLDHEENR